MKFNFEVKHKPVNFNSGDILYEVGVLTGGQHMLWMGNIQGIDPWSNDPISNWFYEYGSNNEGCTHSYYNKSRSDYFSMSFLGKRSVKGFKLRRLKK